MKKLYNRSAILVSLALILGAGIFGTRTSTPDYTPLEAAGGTTLNGWQADFNEGASGSVSAATGFIVVDVTDSGSSDWHVKLAKYSNSLIAGNSYTLTIRAKASKAIKVNYLVGIEGGGNLAEKWNLDITTSFQDFVITFDALTNLTVNYLFQFGKNWTENEETFAVTVEKILLDTHTPTSLYSDDFSGGIGTWSSHYDGGASGSLSVNSGALEQIITNYGAGNPWLVGPRNNTGEAITSGTKYQLSFDVTVVNAQNYEIAFEDSRLSWEYRAGFNSGSWAAGSHSYRYIFTASTSFDEMYLHFMFGQAGSTNTISMDNVVFSQLSWSSVTEVRPGYYVSEFGDILEETETCEADPETGYGYMDVPMLKSTYYDKLLDSSNMASTLIADYDYVYGQGAGEKVADAVTVEAKWAMLVDMYNLNNGVEPDIELLPMIEESLTKTNGTMVALMLSLLGVGTLAYFLSSKRRLVKNK